MINWWCQLTQLVLCSDIKQLLYCCMTRQGQLKCTIYSLFTLNWYLMFIASFTKSESVAWRAQLVSIETGAECLAEWFTRCRRMLRIGRRFSSTTLRRTPACASTVLRLIWWWRLTDEVGGLRRRNATGELIIHQWVSWTSSTSPRLCCIFLCSRILPTEPRSRIFWAPLCLRCTWCFM